MLLSLLTFGVRNGKALAVGVSHGVALASLLLAVLASVVDDNAHLACMPS